MPAVIDKALDFIGAMSGERTVIKNPEYFSTYMQEELKALV